MKTQLIPLESHDDLISIRDRMSWAKTPRILLLWPKSERISLRPLDLKVLQRHAASLGAQLGLVTRHRHVRRQAQALGIPVFNSAGQAQRKPWPERESRRKRSRRLSSQELHEKRKQVRVGSEAWHSHPVLRIGFFSLGVLAVLVMASLFIPHARVILTPKTDIQTTTLPILADPSVKTVFITGSIPSRELRVVVEGSQEAPVTGRIPIPQNKAKGTVTFRNLTNEPVDIAAGTVLTSTGLPGIRFVTVEAGELEAGLQETVDVPVQAENPGSAGNVDAGAILAIEGNLGLLVTVTNEEPTTGGNDRMMEAATERDMARLREGLLAKLEDQAQREMETMLAPGDQIFSDTLKVGQIMDENFDPPLGQPGKNVKLHMQVEFVASYASEKDLTELASTVLNASLPEGFVAVQAPLDFEPLNAYLTDERGITHWSVRVSRQLENKMDTGRIIPMVQGRSMATATKRLNETLSLSNPAEIQLEPEWWPWLPLIPFNITVETR
jgi:hypothetical protein